MEHYDAIIVGGGAAGLTAALYTSRRAVKTLVISQDIGGQAATTALIENYPGIESIDGFELMMTFKSQAEKYGARVSLGEVQSIVRSDEGFTVQSSIGTFSAPAVIMAQGLTHRHLNVPGEDILIGKGVSYCATCDAPLFRGKPVAVVGGGNSAMDAALLLAKFCPQVDLLTVNSELRGEQVLMDRVNETKNISVHYKVTVTGITGSDTVTGLSFSVDEQVTTLPVAGVFVEIGYTVNPALMKNLVALDPRNQILINPENNGTNVPGLFGAGDVTTITQKQVIISAGEGAKAALGVYQYLQSLRKMPPAGLIDWGRSTPRHHERESPDPSPSSSS